MMKACFALCLKRYVKGTDAEDWPKDPICLQYLNLQSMQVFLITDSIDMPRTPIKVIIFPCVQ